MHCKKYFVANTCRYNKTKKCGIEPKIMAEINYYDKVYIKKYEFSCKLFIGYPVIYLNK